jgi:hypothetical protein
MSEIDIEAQLLKVTSSHAKSILENVRQNLLKAAKYLHDFSTTTNNISIAVSEIEEQSSPS